MCTQLKLLDAADISKDDLIKITSDAMFNNYGDTTNGIISLIDEEGRDEIRVIVNIFFFYIKSFSKCWALTFDIFDGTNSLLS